MKLYKVSTYRIEIEKIEVTRKTDSSFWYLLSNGKERRELLDTSYYKYFETWQQAKDYIIKREEDQLKRASKSLEEAINDLEKAKSLTNVPPH